MVASVDVKQHYIQARMKQVRTGIRTLSLLWSSSLSPATSRRHDTVGITRGNHARHGGLYVTVIVTECLRQHFTTYNAILTVTPEKEISRRLLVNSLYNLLNAFGYWGRRTPFFLNNVLLFPYAVYSSIKKIKLKE